MLPLQLFNGVCVIIVVNKYKGKISIHFYQSEITNLFNGIWTCWKLRLEIKCIIHILNCDILSSCINCMRAKRECMIACTKIQLKLLRSDCMTFFSYSVHLHILYSTALFYPNKMYMHVCIHTPIIACKWQTCQFFM